MQGREQEGLPQRRERFEPDRSGRLGQYDTLQALTLPAAFDVEVGKGTKIRELGPAPGEERERSPRVFGDGLARRRQQAGTTGSEREEEGEEASGSAVLSNHA